MSLEVEHLIPQVGCARNKHPPPVGTRNRQVLGSLDPTPEQLLRRRGAQGVVWVKPSRLDPQSWGPGLSPYRAILVKSYIRHVRLERRVTFLPYVVFTGRGRDEGPPSGSFYSPVIPCLYGVGGLLQKPPVNHRVPDAAGRNCRDCW